MKKKIVSKVFAILLAACTVLSACGNESGNQSVGQTDKSETMTLCRKERNHIPLFMHLMYGYSRQIGIW